MAVRWEFRCFVSADGTDEIHDWFRQQSKQVRARFQSRLSMLAKLPFAEWNDTLHKALHGDCKGLNEIRFKGDRVQQRPLGFRSGEFEFTILFCAKEKSNKFVPANACEKALERKREVTEDKDGSRTNALWLALE
jgi:hypothetical protein